MKLDPPASDYLEPMQETPSLIHPPSAWHDWYNAAVYQSFIDEFPVYPWLNRQLAAKARLAEASRILDLACGTGATALGCLPEMHRDAQLVGIDSSLPMVEIARAEVRDPRCRFVVGDARRLAQYVSGCFDRAVCNAAFWQLEETRLVLAELARVLCEGAGFIFSIPSSYLAETKSPVHPFQVALARRLQTAGLRERGTHACFHSIGALIELLESEGFRTHDVTEAHYRGRQKELVDLMRIPAMAEAMSDRASEADRHEAITQAVEGIDLEQEVTVSWTFIETHILQAKVAQSS